MRSRTARDSGDRVGVQDARALDPWVLIAAAVLVGLGLLNLYSVGMEALAARHAAIGVMGFVLMLAVARVRVEALPRFAWAMYGLAVALLLAVLFAGETVKGAQRWLDLGVVSIQPSELAKLAVLVLLGHLLARGYTRWRLFSVLGLSAVPIGLIALQPDLSTTFVVTAVVVFMILLARVPLLPLVPIFGIAIASLPLALLALRPYQLDRLAAFTTGARGSEGPGWAALQAEIAIGGGGLFGRAREQLFDLRAAYLPEREHDLAFASLVHGWGLIAGLIAVAAVLVIVWRAALASRWARSRTAALIAAGTGALFGLHAVIPIAANLTLLPHTGLPIPLFSYGGSIAIVHFVALGLVLAARRDGADRPLWAAAPTGRAHPRLARTGALVLSVNLAAMGWFTWHVQVARGDELQGVSEEQMTRCITVPAERGIIEDRNGEPLVENTDRSEVHVVPGLFQADDGPSMQRLASMVGQSPSELQATLDEGTELNVEIATVDAETAQQVEAAGLAGVLVMPAQRRDYPYGEMLGPMLGFVGVGTPADMSRWPSLQLGSVVGRSGLEQQYDAILRGTDGAQCVYVDPAGEPVAAAGRTNPVPGEDLRLHLDLDLHRKATEALDDAVSESGGDLGAAVVMDARTGGVRAMASVPAYDNNVYSPPVDTSEVEAETERPGLPTLEHGSQVPAAPGSTYKLVVAAANAVHGAIPHNEVIPTGASFSFGGHSFENWRPMGPHDMIDAIAMSDNVYFYKLALRLGVENMASVADELGVGKPTGIDLPGEHAGFLGTPETVEEGGGQWYPGSTVLMGIGQGPVTVTPLNAARWTAALATGELVRPQLGSRLESGSATSLPSAEPEELSFADDLEPVRDGMRAVAARGTGGQLNEVPIPIGAKTGTAEDPGSAGDEHAWFSAVAPFDDPEIVVSVLVHGGGFGSDTSGPVVQQLLEHYVDTR